MKYLGPSIDIHKIHDATGPKLEQSMMPCAVLEHKGPSSQRPSSKLGPTQCAESSRSAQATSLGSISLPSPLFYPFGVQNWA